MQVRQLQVGSRVEAPLLVRTVQVRRRREGGELIALTLADRTGSVPAIVLDGVEAARAACRAGEVAHVCGVAERSTSDSGPGSSSSRFAPPPSTSTTAAELVDGPARPVARMEQDLRELDGHDPVL